MREGESTAPFFFVFFCETMRGREEERFFFEKKERGEGRCSVRSLLTEKKKRRFLIFFFDGQPTWKYLVRVGWGLKDWRGDGWMTMDDDDVAKE